MRGIGADAGEHAVLGHHAVRTAASGLDFHGEVYQDDHDAVSGWASAGRKSPEPTATCSGKLPMMTNYDPIAEQ
jgi:hypothetical protein